MTRPLYAIGADLAEVNDILDECGSEVSEESLARMGIAEKAFTEWLDNLAQEEAAKLDQYIGLVRTLEMEQSAAKAEAEQWQAKAKSRERRIEWLKARMKDHLERTNRTRIVTATGRVLAIQTNGGLLPVVPEGWATSIDVGFVPHELRKQVIDTDLVRKFLNDGGELKFCRLGERSSHLRIR